MTSLTDFRYLEEEHIKYCYDGATGIAKLPLNAVYADGVRDPSRPTTGSLPNGDKFNASTSYKRLLSFFTSTSVSPDELTAMGYKKLEALLSEVFKFVFAAKGRVRCLIVNRKAPLLTLTRRIVVNSLKQLNRIVELSQYLFQGYQQTVWGGRYNLCNNKIFFEIKDYILKIIFKRYRNKGQDLTRFLFILRECRTYKVSY